MSTRPIHRKGLLAGASSIGRVARYFMLHCLAAHCEIVRAESPAAKVFHDCGLIGTWSPDCSRPPSRENPRVSWQQVRGEIVHTVSFDGRTAALRDRVGIATADGDGDGDITLSLVRVSGLSLTITVRLTENRMWTLRSVDTDGHVFYDHGIEIATGKPSLADERCVKLVS